MFNFGRNWKHYLANTDVEANARHMERSLEAFHEPFGGVRGKSFLDLGSGSGLASLAAVRLGAARVVSADIGDESVACTRALRDAERTPEARWEVLKGSILDAAFMERLPQAEIVYSWGVLHHTGDMARAFARACAKVAPGGAFHTAIYNRTLTSPVWRAIKRTYNERGPVGRAVLHNGWFVYNAWARALGLKHPFKRERGMSVYYDAVDWLGGYPYEYATHDEIVELVRGLGPFSLVKSKRDSGFGCNEFLFRRAR